MRKDLAACFLFLFLLLLMHNTNGDADQCDDKLTLSAASHTLLEQALLRAPKLVRMKVHFALVLLFLLFLLQFCKIKRNRGLQRKRWHCSI
jgi:hypothetical protein